MRRPVTILARCCSCLTAAATSIQQLHCRDYADCPEGIPYELAGESVIPGIDASNIEAIFEEHTVVSRVDPFAPRRCQYAREERLFDFGMMLAALGGQAGADGASAGVRANLKMVNPTKVSLESAEPAPTCAAS